MASPLADQNRDNSQDIKNSMNHINLQGCLAVNYLQFRRAQQYAYR